MSRIAPPGRALAAGALIAAVAVLVPSTGHAAVGAATDPALPSAAPVLVPVLGPVGQEPGPETPPAPSDPALTDPAELPGVGQPLDAGAVAAAVGPILRGGALGGGRTPASVVDVATGTVLYSAADRVTTPASVLKLVTAVSILDSLGPEAVLSTRTVIADPGASILRVVVVGAGDPSLSSVSARVGGPGTRLVTATMRDLATRTAEALRARGTTAVRVGFDDSLFTGPALHPTWSRAFPAEGVVAPVSALQVDQGRRVPGGVSRVADPAVAAAEALARELAAADVEVRGRIRRVGERADSVPLASVESPSIGSLVERTLATSDNDYAEALARLGALAAGEPASFVGVQRRARQVLAGLGLADGGTVRDGSGLSRGNALLPSTATTLLRTMAVTGPGWVDTGLPVAGATGSLRYRFSAPLARQARGVVRAKTGTLTGVLGLAGLASRPDGRLLAFAFLDDAVPGSPTAARAALDRAVAALVSCDCAAG